VNRNIAEKRSGVAFEPPEGRRGHCGIEKSSNELDESDRGLTVNRGGPEGTSGNAIEYDERGGVNDDSDNGLTVNRGGGGRRSGSAIEHSDEPESGRRRLTRSSSILKVCLSDNLEEGNETEDENGE
jgi:hypothetical protein